jgi:hypothetical protein
MFHLDGTTLKATRDSLKSLIGFCLTDFVPLFHFSTHLCLLHCDLTYYGECITGNAPYLLGSRIDSNLAKANALASTCLNCEPVSNHMEIIGEQQKQQQPRTSRLRGTTTDG